MGRPGRGQDLHRPAHRHSRKGGGLNLQETLAGIAAEFSPATLASSLSAEDMVLTDTIARAGLPIEIFVLDTGRLHGDTLSLIRETRKRYDIEISVYAPDPDAVAHYVAQHSRDAFYGDLELRQRCCEIRKAPTPYSPRAKRAPSRSRWCGWATIPCAP